ncbi:MAG: flagellar biosynthetic protein FliQ [Bdellovibrionota bacterium]
MYIFENYELLNILYKVCIYIMLPIIASMFIVSLLSSALQSVIAVKDETISYLLKIIVMIVLLYFLYPIAKEILVELLEVSLK